MDRLLRTLLRSARRLAVDGDHVGWHTCQRRHPRHEASLELLGVERRQNVAEVVAARRSVAKRAEPPQQLEFLLAEPGDVSDRLRPGKHCQKAQAQHLVQRIRHFAALSRVRQILEIVQENDGFAEGRVSPPVRSITIPRNTKQRITTDSALQPVVTPFFTRSP